MNLILIQIASIFLFVSCSSDNSSSAVDIFSESAENIEFSLEDTTIQNLSSIESDSYLWVEKAGTSADQPNYNENFVSCRFVVSESVDPQTQEAVFTTSSIQEIAESEIEDAEGLWEVKFNFDTNDNQRIESISCFTYANYSLSLNKINQQLLSVLSVKAGS